MGIWGESRWVVGERDLAAQRLWEGQLIQTWGWSEEHQSGESDIWAVALRFGGKVIRSVLYIMDAIKGCAKTCNLHLNRLPFLAVLCKID